MNQKVSNQKDLRRKLKALMVIRLIVVTLALIAGSLVLQLGRKPFYILIAAFYFVSIIYSVLSYSKKFLYILAYLQIIIDIILETVVIHYTGGAVSIYAFLYIPSIVAAGIVVSPNAAKMIALLSSLLYGVLSLLELVCIIPSIMCTQTAYGGGAWFIIFVTSFRIIIFCLVGYLSSYLSRAVYQGQTALAKLHSLVDFVFNNISNGVITIDKNDRIIYSNPYAQEFLGQAGKIIIGTYWPILFWKEVDNTVKNNFILQAKGPKGAELNIQKQDGSSITLRCNYSQIADKKGRFSGCLITFKDITILKELELIAKPFAVGELRNLVQRELEHKHLIQKAHVLKTGIQPNIQFGDIVGKSKVMQDVYRKIEKVAATDSTVLIYGESGTGKELVAKAVHYNSLRRSNPFVVINCAGLPESLLESELFGHIKGAFTGAVNNKDGLFKAADRGSIFLDEISAASPAIQVKLLRVLQEKQIKQVGSTENIYVDVRVIAATNKRLEQEIDKGRFREDLYYRLSIIPIELPPLRSRKEDIPLLVKHFLDKYSGKGKRNLKVLGQGVMDIFFDYNWPGNIRELENTIERTATLCEGNEIQIRDIPEEIIRNSPNSSDKYPNSRLKEVMKQKEREYIQMIIQKNNGNKKAAAKVLGVDLATLYRKI